MAVPAVPSHDHPALFRAERDRLLLLLGGLAAADWHRPTPCPGWDVLDLTLHLLGGDLSILARSRDGHEGTPVPADVVDEDGFIDWLDRLQVEWVRAARRISPRLAVDLLAITGRQLHELLAAQPVGARTAQVSWASDEPVPVWLDQARELSEYWIHRQQLADALGRPPDLEPEATAAVLDALRWAYPHRLARHPARPGDAVRVRVVGPVTMSWTFVATGGSWLAADTVPPRPAGSEGGDVAAELVLSTDHAWRLLTNNLPADRQETLERRGDPSLLRVLVGTRAIIGHPNSSGPDTAPAAGTASGNRERGIVDTSTYVGPGWSSYDATTKGPP